MSNPKPIDALDAYEWGACPCGRPGDHCVNIPCREGAEHWMICEACQTRWNIGTNLFTGWMDRLDEEGGAAWDEWWLQAKGVLPIPFLTAYREVEGDSPGWAVDAMRRETERYLRRASEVPRGTADDFA